jgi:hypothetical protein
VVPPLYVVWEGALTLASGHRRRQRGRVRQSPYDRLCNISRSSTDGRRNGCNLRGRRCRLRQQNSQVSPGQFVSWTQVSPQFVTGQVLPKSVLWQSSGQVKPQPVWGHVPWHVSAPCVWVSLVMQPSASCIAARLIGLAGGAGIKHLVSRDALRIRCRQLSKAKVEIEFIDRYVNRWLHAGSWVSGSILQQKPCRVVDFSHLNLAAPSTIYYCARWTASATGISEWRCAQTSVMVTIPLFGGRAQRVASMKNRAIYLTQPIQHPVVAPTFRRSSGSSGGRAALTGRRACLAKPTFAGNANP